MLSFLSQPPHPWPVRAASLPACYPISMEHTWPLGVSGEMCFLILARAGDLLGAEEDTYAEDQGPLLAPLNHDMLRASYVPGTMLGLEPRGF